MSGGGLVHPSLRLPSPLRRSHLAEVSRINLPLEFALMEAERGERRGSVRMSGSAAAAGDSARTERCCYQLHPPVQRHLNPPLKLLQNR